MTDLGRTLSLLSSRSLVRRVLSESGTVFRFRHSLDRQAAYHSLLRKDREEIHKVVGEAIERHPADEIEALAPILAEHFSVGKDDRRALKYFILAGDAAARIYAHQEALHYYRQALSIVEKTDGDAQTLSDLYLRQGRTQELSGDFQSALDTYRRLEQIGRSRGDVSLELTALTRQTTLLVSPSAVVDVEAGAALAAKLLDLSVAAGDREAEARARWSLLLSSIYRGQLDQGISEGEKALELAKELGLNELQAYVANDLSGPHLMSNHQERAWDLLDEAIDKWHQLDNLPMLVDSLGNKNTALIFKGQYDEALENSRQAREIADRIDNYWARAFSLFLIELVHAERGDFETALAVCADQVHWGRIAGFKLPEVYSNAFRAWIYSYLGDFDRSETYLSEASAAGPGLGEMWSLHSDCIRLLVSLKQKAVPDPAAASMLDELGTEGFVSFINSPMGSYWVLAMGEIDLANGRYRQGIDRLDLVIHRKHGMSIHMLLVDQLELLARLYRASGDPRAAYDALAKGLDEAERITSRRMLWVLHAERALWLEEDGRHNEALEARRQAQPAFDFVLAHIGDVVLRKSFVDSAWVRGLGMQ